MAGVNMHGNVIDVGGVFKRLYNQNHDMTVWFYLIRHS